MPIPAKILLTFDVEEFDLPLEYKQPVLIDQQLATGFDGLQEIFTILDLPHITTTLFTTAVFAKAYSDSIRELSGRHEIASHCFSHTTFKNEDLLLSRQTLETLIGKEVTGLRMPRMRRVDPEEVFKAGYRYNSSVNPTWVPGRYNNLKLSRRSFMEEGILQFPVSVTPRWRIPLFWLAFKNMPYPIYRQLVLQTLRKEKYVCLYFHPWEFTDLSAYRLPFYIKKAGSTNALIKLRRLISDLSNETEFITMQDYIQQEGLHGHT